MGPTLTLQRLVLRQTSLTSASMAGTSGYIIGTSKHLFLTKRSD
jgi:hypothetical protein